MRIAAALVTAVLAFACLTAVAQDNKRAPSTPEERKRFVAITRDVIRAPLDTKRADVGWALQWLAEVPDIVVNPCPIPLENLTASGNPYAAAIFSAYVMAMGAFTIEQPDKAKDPASQFMAGVEAAIRVYQTIRKTDSAAASDDMDDLIARRQAGTLGGFVQEASKACTTTEGGGSTS